MHSELLLNTGYIYGFLLVLARVSGALIFVPIPGMKNGADPARIFFAITITIALFPRWPMKEIPMQGLVEFVGIMVSEATLGITIGVVVSFLIESVTMGAQILNLQTGFGFASMVDPTTQAESGVLLVMAQLMAGLFFFGMRLDHQVLLAFSRSLDVYAPGAFEISRPMAERVIQLGSTIFVTGIRLVLPVIALLIMVDLALALLGRLNPQLQLMSLIFPAKILTSLAMLSWILILFPRLFGQTAEDMMGFVRGVVHL